MQFYLKEFMNFLLQTRLNGFLWDKTSLIPIKSSQLLLILGKHSKILLYKKYFSQKPLFCEKHLKAVLFLAEKYITKISFWVNCI